MRRAVRITLVGVGAALALAAASCGEEDSGADERLADSIQAVVEDDISSGQAFSVLDASCDGGDGGRYTCTVNIGASPDAIQEEFAVSLGDEGCWEATRVSLSRATGRSLDDEELPARTLRGCVE